MTVAPSPGRVSQSDPGSKYQALPEWQGEPERLADADFAGMTWFHVHGYGGNVSRFDTNVYGTCRRGKVIVFTFVQDLVNDRATPVADVTAKWASVMATVEWS